MDIAYDIVIAGGSIAGAALGCVAQRHGARVLIIEPERTFRDRVRGESLHAWGVAEAHKLGLQAVLEDAGAWRAQFWDTHVGGLRVDRRDLQATTVAQLGGLNVHHPELQTALLTAAENAGVQVRRGARVIGLAPSERGLTELEVVEADAVQRVTARLAVVADGRSSQLRQSLGIVMAAEPSPLRTTGVLLEGVPCREPAVETFYPSEFGEMCLMLPMARGRTRLYVATPRSADSNGWSGDADLPALSQRCVALGVPPAWLSQARAVGPLATFDTTCRSLPGVALPEGVAFVGDAAGNVDPAWGCGMSLALRDARFLLESWLECGEWRRAAQLYTPRRRAYHAALLRTEGWMRRILFTRSPEGDAIRARAFSLFPTLGVDLTGLGPDGRSDDHTERELFGDLDP
jgi:2-polyprenyl-6-methoxyphenol hydroxylase-like FAD-dependent oxidoreductase